MTLELDAMYFGKGIYTYDHRIGKCSEADIKHHLKDVDRLEMLRLLSDLSTNIYDNDQPIVMFEKIPVTQYILNMASFFVVKYSNDNLDLGNIVSKAEHLIRMCQKLLELETLKITNNPDELLLLTAYQQFPYQETDLNQVSRSIFMYIHLWGKISKVIHIKILKHIEKIIGIPYETALLFTYMIVGSKKSYLFQFKSDYIKKFNLEFNLNLTTDCHKKYLEWCSGDYKKITDYNGSVQPLVKYPIIQTNSHPNKEGVVFLVPNKKGLYLKLTNNLYYSLIEKFNKGKGANEFKMAFGYVFEEYVGELLKFHFKSWKVIPEITYSKTKIKSSDWFLYKDNRLLIIEVKQSSVFVKTKSSGNLKSLYRDLKKTLIKGANQIERTANEVKSQKFNAFNIFKNVKHIQSLILVHDPFFQANSIGRDIIQNTCKMKTPYHIIGISEFENFLDYQKDKEDLFDVLNFKASTDTNIQTDFKEFLIQYYQKPLKVSFLKKIHADFFKSLKI